MAEASAGGADRVYKVGVSGSYGGLNLGDEAILQSIIRQLRATLPVEITVFSRDPGDTLRRHGVERAVPVREMTRGEACQHIRELDLFILGGGGILFDAEADIYTREVMLAHEMGAPVMVYAVSAGPLKSRTAQQQVRDALRQAAVVTVRDREAKKILENIGVEREILVTADPALLTEPEPVSDDLLLREGFLDEGRLVGLSVREPGPAAPDLDHDVYHALIANAADFIIDRYDADVVFVPMERGRRDLQHSHAVIAKMLRPQRARTLQGDYSPGQILWLMRRFTFCVGMRLHFLIFAALAGTPFVALPYSSKVQGFLTDLELAFPPLNLVSAGRLIAYVDQIWDSREAIRERVGRLLPELRRRARENNRLATDLLRGAPTRAAVGQDACPT